MKPAGGLVAYPTLVARIGTTPSRHVEPMCRSTSSILWVWTLVKTGSVSNRLKNERSIEECESLHDTDIVPVLRSKMMCHLHQFGVVFLEILR